MNKPQKRQPQRKCVGCGEIKDKNTLIRIVRTPEKNGGADADEANHSRIEIDARGKMSGRGAYLCKNEECLTKATKSKRLEKNLEYPVSEAIYNELRQKLAGIPPEL